MPLTKEQVDAQVARAKAVLAQTAEEGKAPFAGSSYDKGIPLLPSETQTATNAAILPATGEPANNLVAFKNVLARISQAASQSRNEMALTFLGTPSATNPISPDTFTSVLSSLNKASDTYAEDIKKNTLKAFEPDWQTITETDDAGRVTAVIYDRNNPSKQKKVDLGKIGKSKADKKEVTPEILAYLEAGQKKIDAGTDINAVRRVFLQKFPEHASIFNEYTKSLFTQ